MIALFAGAISAFVIAGFNQFLWEGHRPRPFHAALQVGKWAGGLPWAIAFVVAAGAERFRGVEQDVFLPLGTLLAFIGLFASPFMSVALRGARPEDRPPPPSPSPDGRRCADPRCSHVNRPGARFCAVCGRPLDHSVRR